MFCCTAEIAAGRALAAAGGICTAAGVIAAGRFHEVQRAACNVI
jgi:hypothetical protein